MNLTETWVLVIFEVLAGEPDTVFLTHSLNKQKLLLISVKVLTCQKVMVEVFSPTISSIFMKTITFSLSLTNEPSKVQQTVPT